MKRSREIIGLRVMCFQEGYQGGFVSDMIVDPEKKSIRYLISDLGTGVLGFRCLSFDKVIGIGQDYITTQNKDSIQSVFGVDDINKLSYAGSGLLGAKMVSSEGNVIGVIEEYYVDERTGEIAEFHLEDKTIIGAEFVLSIAPGIVFAQSLSDMTPKSEKAREPKRESQVSAPPPEEKTDKAEIKTEFVADMPQARPAESVLPPAPQPVINVVDTVPGTPSLDEVIKAAAPEVKPVVAEEKPVVEKPVIQEAKPVIAEEKPAVQEVKPVIAEEKPAAPMSILDELKLRAKSQPQPTPDILGELSGEKRSPEPISAVSAVSASTAYKEQITPPVKESAPPSVAKPAEEPARRSFIGGATLTERAREISPEATSAVPTADAKPKGRLFDKLQSQYFINRTVKEDIFDDSGKLLLAKGALITKEALEEVKKAGKIVELTMNVE